MISKLRASALFLTTSLLLLALPAHARTMVELRQAEKIALSLTGEPLPDDLRQKFLKGEVTLENIADTLSQSPSFIQYYAQYWTRTLGVQSPMDAYELRNKDGRAVNDQDNVVGVDRLTDDCGERTANALQSWIDSRTGKTARIQVRNDCEDAPRIEVYSDFTDYGEAQTSADKGILGHHFDNKPIYAGTQDLWKNAYYNIVKPARAACGDDSTGTVMKVWWDPDTVRSHARYKNAKGYRVPPWVLKVCGDKLEKCGLNDAAGVDTYMDQVDRDMSMEAGYLIAHTVAENKPFTDILTTKDTIMTGTYGYFMGKGRGKILTGNFPGGSIADYGKPLFQSPDLLDTKHYWVKRGDLHAGVLTTPIYHAVTNGRRAKANRAYETFLCRKFVVPDGAAADPSDANPDLTKRTYCDNCHKSLEPMAAFFNRWPETGSVNYIYNADKGVSDTGRYDGQTGDGAVAFGKILTQAEEFNDCGVKRAFEFINGRKMTDDESTNMVEDYKAVLKSSGMNMREILKKLVLAPEFLSPKAQP